MGIDLFETWYLLSICSVLDVKTLTHFKHLQVIQIDHIKESGSVT